MSNVLPTEKKVMAVSLLAEGSSIRPIERVTGVHRDTIMRLALSLVVWTLPGIVVAQPGVNKSTGNAPINFYGQVIDQDGNPLPDAKVALELNVGWMKSPTEGDMKVEQFTTQTDASGTFALTNKEGHSIRILNVEKQGYELSPKVARTYSYNVVPLMFHSEQDHPVIFKMWKKRGAGELINSAWRGNVACNGTTNLFDLRHGSRGAAGDLEIICSRSPLQLPPHTNSVFDYSFQVTIIGGGIQPTEDEFSYLAPEAGYSETFAIGHNATDSNWTAKVSHEFYIKTAEGNFGRLWVDWYSTQTSPAHLEWNCSINSSGSRNLER